MLPLPGYWGGGAHVSNRGTFVTQVCNVVIEQVSANSRPLQNKGLKRGGDLQLYEEAVFVLFFVFLLH